MDINLKYYDVEIPVSAKIEKKVLATSGREALNIALQDCTLEHITEWEPAEELITGYVSHLVCDTADVILDEELTDEKAIEEVRDLLKWNVDSLVIDSELYQILSTLANEQNLDGKIIVADEIYEIKTDRYGSFSLNIKQNATAEQIKNAIII